MDKLHISEDIDDEDGYFFLVSNIVSLTKLNWNNLRDKKTKGKKCRKENPSKGNQDNARLNAEKRKPDNFFLAWVRYHSEIEPGSSSSMPVRHTMTMNESCVLLAINFRLLLQRERDGFVESSSREERRSI